MKDKRLCESDYRLLSAVWDYEPINSMELSRICEDRIGWKKSTTFTILRKLCDKGYIKNEHAIVTSVIPKDEIRAREGELFVKYTFSGSLYDFLALYFKTNKLTAEKAEEIKKLIDANIEG